LGRPTTPPPPPPPPPEHAAPLIRFRAIFPADVSSFPPRGFVSAGGARSPSDDADVVLAAVELEPSQSKNQMNRNELINQRVG